MYNTMNMENNKATTLTSSEIRNHKPVTAKKSSAPPPPPIPIADNSFAQNQASCKPHIIDLFPTPEQSKWAMLRSKTKFIRNMDRFSSRKNAYKQGWRDCYSWLASKNNTPE